MKKRNKRSVAKPANWTPAKLLRHAPKHPGRTEEHDRVYEQLAELRPEEFETAPSRPRRKK